MEDASVRDQLLEEMRTRLSDPLTADQADALRGIAHSNEDIDEVMDWLRSGTASRADYFVHLAKASAPVLDPISGNPVQGYWLKFGAEGEFRHLFGGASPVPGEQCINCEKQLLHFLSLDTTDERLNLQKLGTPFLPLLFCWTCETGEMT